MSITMLGELLIRSTAILAVACYGWRVLIEMAGPSSDRWQVRARWCWTLGCLAMIAHVVCAFHVQHGWSHAAAWEHTRQRTLELTGWNTGGGIYANEAMTIIWVIDVVGWWRSLAWPLRHRAWFWVVQAFFAFMVVNATVVFGPGYWIVVGAIGIIAVAIAGRRRSAG